MADDKYTMVMEFKSELDEKDLKELTKWLDKIDSKLDKTNKNMERLGEKSSLSKIVKESNKANSSLEKLDKEIKATNKSLGNLKVNQITKMNKEIKKTSDSFSKVNKTIKDINKSLKSLSTSSSLNRVSSSIEKINTSFNDSYKYIDNFKKALSEFNTIRLPNQTKGERDLTSSMQSVLKETKSIRSSLKPMKNTIFTSISYQTKNALTNINHLNQAIARNRELLGGVGLFDNNRPTRTTTVTDNVQETTTPTEPSKDVKPPSSAMIDTNVKREETIPQLTPQEYARGDLNPKFSKRVLPPKTVDEYAQVVEPIGRQPRQPRGGGGGGSGRGGGAHGGSRTQFGYPYISNPLMGALGFFGVSSMEDTIVNTGVQNETNKLLLQKMGADYDIFDEATNKTLTSMQDLIPAMNAMYTSANLTADEVNNTAETMATFGSYVKILTGSDVLSRSSMYYLSRAYHGEYRAVDQYGITDASLKNTGLYKGAHSGDTYEHFMDAVNAVMGEQMDELMKTTQGQISQTYKGFTRGGKQISQAVLPVLRTALDVWNEVNDVLANIPSQLALLGTSAMSLASIFTNFYNESMFTLDTLSDMFKRLQNFREGKSFLGQNWEIEGLIKHDPNINPEKKSETPENVVPYNPNNPNVNSQEEKEESITEETGLLENELINLAKKFKETADYISKNPIEYSNTVRERNDKEPVFTNKEDWEQQSKEQAENWFNHGQDIFQGLEDEITPLEYKVKTSRVAKVGRDTSDKVKRSRVGRATRETGRDIQYAAGVGKEKLANTQTGALVGGIVSGAASKGKEAVTTTGKVIAKGGVADAAFKGGGIAGLAGMGTSMVGGLIGGDVGNTLESIGDKVAVIGSLVAIFSKLLPLLRTVVTVIGGITGLTAPELVVAFVAILGVVKLIKRYWDNIVGTLKSFFGWVKNVLVTMFVEPLIPLFEAFDNLKGVISDIFGGETGDILVSLGNGILKILRPIGQVLMFIAKIIGGTLGVAFKFFAASINATAKGISLVADIVTKAYNAIKRVVEPFINNIEKIINFVKDKADWVRHPFGLGKDDKEKNNKKKEKEDKEQEFRDKHNIEESGITKWAKKQVDQRDHPEKYKEDEKDNKSFFEKQQQNGQQPLSEADTTGDMNELQTSAEGTGTESLKVSTDTASLAESLNQEAQEEPAPKKEEPSEVNVENQDMNTTTPEVNVQQQTVEHNSPEVNVEEKETPQKPLSEAQETLSEQESETEEAPESLSQVNTEGNLKVETEIPPQNTPMEQEEKALNQEEEQETPLSVLQNIYELLQSVFGDYTTPEPQGQVMPAPQVQLSPAPVNVLPEQPPVEFYQDIPDKPSMLESMRFKLLDWQSRASETLPERVVDAPIISNLFDPSIINSTFDSIENFKSKIQSRLPQMEELPSIPFNMNILNQLNEEDFDKLEKLLPPYISSRLETIKAQREEPIQPNPFEPIPIIPPEQVPPQELLIQREENERRRQLAIKQQEKPQKSLQERALELSNAEMEEIYLKEEPNEYPPDSEMYEHIREGIKEGKIPDEIRRGLEQQESFTQEKEVIPERPEIVPLERAVNTPPELIEISQPEQSEGIFQRIKNRVTAPLNENKFTQPIFEDNFRERALDSLRQTILLNNRAIPRGIEANLEPVPPLNPEIQPPILQPTPVTTQQPIIQPTPVTTQQPIIQPTPVTTQQPIIQPTPVTTQQPIIQPTPVNIPPQEPVLPEVHPAPPQKTPVPVIIVDSQIPLNNERTPFIDTYNTLKESTLNIFDSIKEALTPMENVFNKQEKGVYQEPPLELKTKDRKMYSEVRKSLIGRDIPEKMREGIRKTYIPPFSSSIYDTLSPPQRDRGEYRALRDLAPPREEQRRRLNQLMQRSEVYPENNTHFSPSQLRYYQLQQYQNQKNLQLAQEKQLQQMRYNPQDIRRQDQLQQKMGRAFHDFNRPIEGIPIEMLPPEPPINEEEHPRENILHKIVRSMPMGIPRIETNETQLPEIKQGDNEAPITNNITVNVDSVDSKDRINQMVEELTKALTFENIRAGRSVGADYYTGI